MSDFAGINGWEFDELGEDVEARGANIYGFGFDAGFGQGSLQNLEDSGFARAFLRALWAERTDAILLEAQATRFVNLELGELEAARPEING